MYSDVIISATSRASREDNQTDRQTDGDKQQKRRGTQTEWRFVSESKSYVQTVYFSLNHFERAKIQKINEGCVTRTRAYRDDVNTDA